MQSVNAATIGTCLLIRTRCNDLHLKLAGMLRSEALPYPVGHLLLWHVAGGDSQHDVDGIELIEHQRLTVERQVLRPIERRLHRVKVAYTGQAAIHCKLLVMNRKNGFSLNPLLVHLASTRRISRSSCMIESAKAIWRSKSGLRIGKA